MKIYSHRLVENPGSRLWPTKENPTIGIPLSNNSAEFIVINALSETREFSHVRTDPPPRI